MIDRQRATRGLVRLGILLSVVWTFSVCSLAIYESRNLREENLFVGLRAYTPQEQEQIQRQVGAELLGNSTPTPMTVTNADRRIVHHRALILWALMPLFGLWSLGAGITWVVVGFFPNPR